MGIFYHVTCSNKACRYHVMLREGPGMGSGCRVWMREKAIRSGEESAPPEIVSLLEKGESLRSVTTFLCPVCKEWMTRYDPYVFEAIRVSPYGTVREYRLHFLDGTPKCEKCGAELIHIPKPRSPKYKCPKCGIGTMVSRGEGFYD